MLNPSWRSTSTVSIGMEGPSAVAPSALEGLGGLMLGLFSSKRSEPGADGQASGSAAPGGGGGGKPTKMQRTKPPRTLVVTAGTAVGAEVGVVELELWAAAAHGEAALNE